jgi:hypothetical protein
MTNKKPKTSKKQSRNSRSILWVLGSIVVVLILIFLFRGWFRVTVIPKTAGQFYSNGVKDTANKEATALNNPFGTLGLATPKTSDVCTLQQAQSIHTEINCYTNQEGYTKLPTSFTGLVNIQKQTSSLQTLLNSNGWQAGSNGVTLTSLINGTAKGIDYSPDAFYQKIIGNTDCTFDTMIAYANPQPPAIRVTFSCSRTINFLGAPKDETYNSSKGL